MTRPDSKTWGLQKFYHLFKAWHGQTVRLGVCRNTAILWGMWSAEIQPSLEADNRPHGSLARYVKLQVAHAPGMPGTCSPPLQVSDADMHHGTCVTHVPCCMPGSLTSGFLWSRWWGKRSRHSRRICYPQYTYLVRGPYIRCYEISICVG